MSDFNELFGDTVGGSGAPELTLVAMFRLVDAKRALMEVDRLELFREFFRALTGVELTAESTTFELAWADTTQRREIYAQDIFMDTAHLYEPCRVLFSQMTASLRGRVKQHILSSGSYEAVAFKPDGLRIFRIASDDRIYSHVLTTAWDLSTIATGTSISPVQAVWTDAIDLKLSPDGLWVYVSKINSSIFWYAPLSVAWDITTVGTFVSRDPGVGTNISAGDFSLDGLNYYYLSGTGGIYKSELSTAWDPATMSQASTANIAWTGGTQLTLNYHQLQFSNNGSRLWWTYYVSSVMYIACIDLATPYLPSSAIVSTFNYRAVEQFMGQAQQYMPVHIVNDGKKIFTIAGNNYVRSVELPVAGNLFSVDPYPQAGTAQVVSSSIRTPSGLAAWTDVEVSECGQYVLLLNSDASNSTCVSLYTPTPWSFSSLEFLGSFNPGAYYTNPSFSPDGRFFALIQENGSYRQWSIGQPFNVGTVLTQTARVGTFSTGSRYDKVRIRHFKGMSKMFFADFTENLIITMDTELNGAMPNSTLFTSSKQQFSIAGIIPSGWHNHYFSPDGKRIICFRNNGYSGYEFSLTTPYNITTAKTESFLQNVSTLSIQPSLMNLRNMRDFYHINATNAASNASCLVKINAKPSLIL